MLNAYKDKIVSVIGLGYIGLPSAAALASRGVKVIGVDINQHAVDTINQGNVHIVEPELDIVVRASVNQGYLRATTTPQPADAFLIAVPTPINRDHEPDMSYVEAAAKSVASVLKRGDLVILESTSPVGATEQIAGWMAEVRPDLTFPQQFGENSDIRVAHCPERVLPGHVLRELVENDRVIGGLTPKCSAAAVELYKVFVEGECVVTNARTAEMCKLTENASRDVSIAFANELSLICDKLGVDVWELIKLANRHPRVNILQPGPGVGGHCIAVDPWFIVSKSPEESQLIRTARLVNGSKPRWVEEKIHSAVAAAAGKKGLQPSAIKIACMGLAFKPDIDDLRESPALEIVIHLGDKYPEQIYVVEPNIDTLPPELAKHGVTLSATNEALDIADVVVLLVDHREFKESVPVLRDGTLLVDTRGVWR
ncbi:UDP-N-acetyl-D-mannosamine dehydrogenase [Sinorhizobium medicae]|uniref:UDP-N-acetyl-D-mannosamine dehydrogenase n=1 Tax=Sinorhizobium medicae TaxID=110321 RepID=A0ABX4TCD3_9HYPH|nr:UDP-N-acetyl-D-mannosamine dehydrogenase [Sinorhizobium medicae]MDX0716623.1 UDP-N-acetyl-D-mannosamine dehydrogenase [Sinorhizobium medicae]MDX0845082.1 UDP-N-acetyl-D-mannosamine dehydrogenase [Sinorhizobium medicae]MDX1059637.1 UDP-N-acetyl-D-mannosamine dehydrogenase [Sinorhizobium medicae]PLT91429.1 UDP-N-acetyl-D-mannosamine dehydrogenase [Sinorhizobium medicae]PLU10453.1 UDP-N-acetyl-D-mannosamine dehydrogenase [Sinorhizobium medicae]